MAAEAPLPGQVSEFVADQEAQKKEQLNSEKLSDNVKRWFNEQNGQTLEGALAFVPFILQESFYEGSLDVSNIVIHTGSGGVVFSDASGFTALTEKLAKKSNGAELLSQCLTAFFTPLIDLINAYRGDTIKFSGDALTIYFPAVDDTQCPTYNGIVPPHGSYGLPDLGPMATAVLRSSACCIEIHKRLHMFETGVDDVRLCLHIGVGCGDIRILQVGGVVPPETHVPRLEYLISGAPLEQISIAEPLAKNGETCLSPQAWEYVKDCVIEGRPLEDRPDFHLLLRMDESKYTFPTIKHATQLYDTRLDRCFKLSELNITRRYIPSAVFKQIECGTLAYVNEMRNISTIFISGSGLDVMADGGPQLAQELMSSVQRACYRHEGTLNKFLIDDKGMLFLLVFGLPPLVHQDDSTRAVLCCMEMVRIFKRLNLIGRFGVTTGRNYCGVCGSAKRMEYTVLGDTVNLSARLMANAEALGILCDEETSKHTTGEVIYTALTPIKVKGKINAIPIFKPTLRDDLPAVGVSRDNKIRLPWYDTPMDGSNIAIADVIPTAKSRLLQLCAVKKWSGNQKIADLLGASFDKSLHTALGVFNLASTKSLPPANNPLSEGGLIILQGATGLGKIELAEHALLHCLTHFHIMPVFGTMGPRPGEGGRIMFELLRSIIGVFQFLNSSLPADESQALGQLLPTSFGANLQPIRELLTTRAALSQVSKEIIAVTLKAAIALIQILKKQTPILLLLQFEHGASLFDKTTKEDEDMFWNTVDELHTVFKTEKNVSVIVLCREAAKSKEAVTTASEKNNIFQLKGLLEENSLEFMASVLDIPEHMVPVSLRRFVTQVTMGNPHYVRETLAQLIAEQHIAVKAGVSATLTAGSLDKINIASWSHTAMVGGTICTLESLDPIESAAMKMSTCFEGAFTLPDLAASSCSQWGGAAFFDLLRLSRATRKLISMQIIAKVPPPVRDTPREEQLGETQYFQMQSAFIRTVGGAMVLEAQKKSVKRNALIDRVLKQDLPERMAALAAKKSVQHIPWYYERALRRMI